LNSSRVAPYEALAEIYDQVMSHVDYVRWTGFAMEVFADHGIPLAELMTAKTDVKILECACGTGTVAGLFSMQGCSVDAFDSSPAMIEVARAKGSAISRAPHFYVADFLALDAEECYDAVLCLYDSVNYLTKPGQLVDFLSRVRRALKPDGLFLFDICTEFNSRLNFSGRKEEGQGPGYHYIRRMRFYPDKMIQENQFEMGLDDRPGELICERHRQRIYTTGEIRRALKQVKLMILEETEDLDRHPPTPEALRVHFLCRR